MYDKVAKVKMSLAADKNHVGPHPEFIKGLFGSISSGYDRANDLMTLGIAHRWRKKLVKWSRATEGDHVLDCATGTGDLALAFKEAVGRKGKVIGTDFCSEMLEKAPLKAQKRKLEVEFALADATRLNFSDSSFDVSSMAFGIRNVQDPLRALTEMARVTRSGGRVMILETGDTQVPLLGPLIRFYFKIGVPYIGGLVTGKRQAYEYLNCSSSSFPGKEKFLNLMKATGAFTFVEYRSLLGGASYLYKGVVK